MQVVESLTPSNRLENLERLEHSQANERERILYNATKESDQLSPPPIAGLEMYLGRSSWVNSTRGKWSQQQCDL